MGKPKAKKRLQPYFPDALRKRPPMRLSLDPAAHEILRSMAGRASVYVSELVLRAEHGRQAALAREDDEE